MEPLLVGGDSCNAESTSAVTEELDRLCRICASPNDYLIPIFEGEGLDHELAMKIEKYLPVKISDGDTLPLNVCYQCASTLIAWHDLFENSVKADKKLRELEDRKVFVDKLSDIYEGPPSVGSDDETFDQPSTSSAIENQGAKDSSTADKCTEISSKDESSQKTQSPAEEEGFWQQCSQMLVNTHCSTVKDESLQQEKSDSVNSMMAEDSTTMCSAKGISSSDFKDYLNAKPGFVTRGKNKNITTSSRKGKGDRLTSVINKLSQFTESFTKDNMNEENISAQVNTTKDIEIHQSVTKKSSKMANSHVATIKYTKEPILGKLMDVKKISADVNITQDVETYSFEKLTCNLCCKKYFNRSTLRRHMKSFHNEKFEETSNNLGKITRVVKKERKKNHSLENHTCKVCCKKFIYISNLKRHIKDVHRIYEQKSSKHNLVKNLEDVNKINEKYSFENLTCNLCCKKYTNRHHLRRHLKEVHKNFEGKTSKIAAALERIRQKKNLDLEKIRADENRVEKMGKFSFEDLICYVCCKLFFTRTGLRAHMKFFHDVKFKKKTYRCDVCRQIYSSINSLKKHQQFTLHKQRIPLNRSVVECDICKKRFANKRVLIVHLDIHGEKSTCHMCGKRMSAGGLLYHIKHVHEGIKNYKCDMCGRCFADKVKLGDHLRSHTGERPFMCSVCGKSFTMSGALNYHMHTHTDTFYSCSICNKKYKGKLRLHRHMAVHSTEKPFSCNICGSSFRLNLYLREHLTSHSEDRPFTCSECGKTFKLSKYLRQHMKSHKKAVSVFSVL